MLWVISVTKGTYLKSTKLNSCLSLSMTHWASTCMFWWFIFSSMKISSKDIKGYPFYLARRSTLMYIITKIFLLLNFDGIYLKCLLHYSQSFSHRKYCHFSIAIICLFVFHYILCVWVFMCIYFCCAWSLVICLHYLSWKVRRRH